MDSLPFTKIIFYVVCSALEVIKVLSCTPQLRLIFILLIIVKSKGNLYPFLFYFSIYEEFKYQLLSMRRIYKPKMTQRKNVSDLLPSAVYFRGIKKKKLIKKKNFKGNQAAEHMVNNIYFLISSLLPCFLVSPICVTSN